MPAPSAYTLTESHRLKTSSSISSSVIVFMDLRYDIAVINTASATSSQTSGWDLIHTESDGITIIPPTTTNLETVTDNTLEFELRSGDGQGGIVVKSGYQAFIGTDNTKRWMPLDDIPLWGLSEFYPSSENESTVGTYTVPVFTTGHPVGSWAVDVFGNYFTSFVYPDNQIGKAYNSLNGNDSPQNVCKLETGSETFSFYPISIL